MVTMHNITQYLRPSTLVAILADLEHSKATTMAYSPAWEMLVDHVGKKEARAMVNKEIKENF